MPRDLGGPFQKTVVGASVPVLVLFAMVIVGMELTTIDSGGLPVSPEPSWWLLRSSFSCSHGASSVVPRR